MKIHKMKGLTLVEAIIFIVTISIVASSILVASIAVLRNAPLVHQQTIATQTAVRCLEWFRGQRDINGFNNIACPSNIVPNFCTTPNNNYSIIVNCDLSADTNYKTITVDVSGFGDTTLFLRLAKYHD